MPQAPGFLAQVLFATAILVPLGATVLGLAYLIGQTIPAGFKGKKAAYSTSTTSPS